MLRSLIFPNEPHILHNRTLLMIHAAWSLQLCCSLSCLLLSWSQRTRSCPRVLLTTQHAASAGRGACQSCPEHLTFTSGTEGTAERESQGRLLGTGETLTNVSILMSMLCVQTINTWKSLRFSCRRTHFASKSVKRI